MHFKFCYEKSLLLRNGYFKNSTIRFLSVVIPHICFKQLKLHRVDYFPFLLRNYNTMQQITYLIKWTRSHKGIKSPPHKMDNFTYWALNMYVPKILNSFLAPTYFQEMPEVKTFHFYGCLCSSSSYFHEKLFDTSIFFNLCI